MNTVSASQYRQHRQLKPVHVLRRHGGHQRSVLCQTMPVQTGDQTPRIPQQVCPSLAHGLWGAGAARGKAHGGQLRVGQLIQALGVSGARPGERRIHIPTSLGVRIPREHRLNRRGRIRAGQQTGLTTPRRSQQHGGEIHAVHAQIEQWSGWIGPCQRGRSRPQHRRFHHRFAMTLPASDHGHRMSRTSVLASPRM